MKPYLSVVIPTYNRINCLIQTLEALDKQSLSDEHFEIIVVDDGSIDETRKVMLNMIKFTKSNIRYFWQENQSAGSARNLGIIEATAPIILLLDSDINVNYEHLESHLKLHQKYKEIEYAILGRIIPGGSGIDLLRRDETNMVPITKTSFGDPIIRATNFVTADVSLKKEFITKAGLFTPRLPVVEDMDLAFRLENIGLKLIYCRQAIAIHMEPLDSVDKVVSYGKKYGRSLAEWYGRIPLFKDEIWKLGGRFNGKWHHFRQHPWGFLKDALRRWLINKYTIKIINHFISRIEISNPPSKIITRCCKEIWAYHYRNEFQKRRHELKIDNF